MLNWWYSQRQPQRLMSTRSWVPQSAEEDHKRKWPNISVKLLSLIWVVAGYHQTTWASFSERMTKKYACCRSHAYVIGDLNVLTMFYTNYFIVKLMVYSDLVFWSIITLKRRWWRLCICRITEKPPGIGEKRCSCSKWCRSNFMGWCQRQIDDLG